MLSFVRRKIPSCREQCQFYDSATQKLNISEIDLKYTYLSLVNEFKACGIHFNNFDGWTQFMPN